MAVVAAADAAAGQSRMIHGAADGRPGGRVVATFAGMRVIVGNMVRSGLKFCLVAAVALAGTPAGQRSVIKRSPSIRRPIIGVVTGFAGV